MTSKKYDTDKLRWDLMPFDSLLEIVKVVTYGAKKYNANNWQDLDNFNDRYFGACLRHLTSWKLGEQVDKESNLRHLAHAGCNIIFLLWKELRNRP